MPSSGLLRRVALVTTVVSEEPSTSISRVTRISESGTTLVVTSSQHASIVKEVKTFLWKPLQSRTAVLYGESNR
jgi:hypothetical protein